ncbi:DUF308 domain-containing protein [Actinokineospora globicatena]|uniref:Uncharacterized protein n=1 Tax=Actinokineospora globicatena TaxID=103729 RepID=A0A9W6QNC4_9PSEU|nr:DUF308 domain-containing protein [Actinokineospora globicatena]MCP2302543.1 hypothetical protein [Actinokineospora globicatena]GLW75770.1 hypothetical protein Aglo01_02520 [Actinokineospora globicatena]GLW82610.1 hypothetical protein Aglo02_02510 [Actinokineospora globicatena]GLW91558.1 hypothetical protein Aglo03_23740 [Actinokineospora globicatena]
MKDGPEDVDAAFAQIVADLEREGVGRDLPEIAKDRVPEDPPADVPARPASTWRAHDTEIDWSNDNNDEHYEPPEPPPLPRLRPLTIVAIVLLTGGVVLLTLASILSWDARITTPTALVALAAGIGLLLLRARKSPPALDDDNGAQV